MNLQLKAIYICCTSNGWWGKGLTVGEAKKKAFLKKGQQFYLMAAVLNNPSEKQLDNLFCCITVNSTTGVPEYYKEDRTKTDSAMIEKCHVGWLTVEKGE